MNGLPGEKHESLVDAYERLQIDPNWRAAKSDERIERDRERIERVAQVPRSAHYRGPAVDVARPGAMFRPMSSAELRAFKRYRKLKAKGYGGGGVWLR